MSDTRRTIVVLLGLAAVLADAALTKSAWGQQFPHFAMVALLAVGLGQTGLLAAWLAVGPGALVGRLGVCLLAVTGLAWLLSFMTRPDFSQWLGFLELYLFAVATPAFVWRYLQSPAKTDAAATTDRSPGGKSPRQWSLAGMMCLTTVVAVALSFARQVDFPRQQVALAVLSCAGFAVTTLVALGIAWRVERWAWHVPAAMLAGLLVGAAVGQMHDSATYLRAMVGASLIQSLVVVLVVDVIRVAARQSALPGELRRAAA